VGRSFLLRLFGGSFLLAAMFCFLPAQAAELDGEQVYKRALKSIVWIVIKEDRGVRMGSGTLIDEEKRIVLTNYHVIRGQKSCFVQFPMYDARKDLINEKDKYFKAMENSAIVANVLHYDMERDLAIIQLDKKKKLPTGVVQMPLSEKSPSPGGKVFAVGNPGASDALWVMSPGDVRQVYKKEYTTGDGKTISFEIKAKIIEATNPTSRGDSGGPLLNTKGELTGVTQGGSPGDNAYSYFIDISEVRGLLKEKKMLPASKAKAPTEVASTNVEDKEKEKVKSEPTEEPVVVKETPKSKGTTPSVVPKDTPSDKDEKAAATKLALIETLISQGKKETAILRLEQLIKDYPKTLAAKDAKELLKKLK
jgi:S1-C subfamily serine protease